MSKFIKRASATLGALAIAVIALVGVTPAHASPANIDPNEARSLTVHAFKNGSRTAGIGAEQPGATSDPVADMPFTAQRVTAIAGQPIDLATTEGWGRIAPYVSGASTFTPGDATLVAGGTATSNAQGVAAFGLLPIGLYWVTATMPNPNTQQLLAPPQPFLVALPMPMVDAAGTVVPGEWRYDVHAYPKPVSTTATKTVDDSAATAIGDTITWRIEARVPVLAPGEQFTNFQIFDMLPTHLAPTSQMGAGAVTAGGTPYAFTAPAPYEFGYDPGPGQSRTYLVGITPAALPELKNIEGGLFWFEVTTRVLSLPDDGVIVNTGRVNINGIDFEVTASSGWGQLRINKVVSGDTTKRLDGAEFQVFATEAAANAAIAAVNAGNATVGAIASQPIGGGTAASTFTTATVSGDAGFVTIPGLKASATGTDYWIVETKAPAGYVRATTPTRVTVTPGVTSVNQVIAEVVNVQQTPGSLPVLGANGMTIAMVGGSALLIGGLLFAAFGRRRKAEAAGIGA